MKIFIFLVDCEWNEFGDWSLCDKDCGGGKHFRTRDVKISAACKGKKCEGAFKEVQYCNNQACPGTPLPPKS